MARPYYVTAKNKSNNISHTHYSFYDAGNFSGTAFFWKELYDSQKREIKPKENFKLAGLGVLENAKQLAAG